MKISTNKYTGERTVLTSWKSSSDPYTGSFIYGLNPLNIPELYVWSGSHPFWRSGPWNGQSIIGVPNMVVNYNTLEVVDDKEGTLYTTYTSRDESMCYFFLNFDGIVVQRYRDVGKENWEDTVLAPRNECDAYGKCGPFGSCNVQDLPICICLQGFESKDIEEWNRGNWTSGCVRRRQLQCCKGNNINGGKGKEDEFLKKKTVKVPAFANGIGCLQRSENLIDIQKFTYGGVDLYIRLGYSDLDIKRNTQIVITIAVIIGSVATAICIYLSWRWMSKPRGRKKIKASPERSNESVLGDKLKQAKFEELTLFSFEALAIATDEFLVANKLGQDPCKKKLLDWRKRASIIEGIGRGLLYLYRDSRLKIIHRDLKRSNILLDEELNPKISDFGMAKICGGNENQANTARIVGTYGYMAPEYAMEWRFSEKSDAWKLWNENRIVMLIDPTISDPCFQVEILRYIHVGLLCVQEFARDTPTISTILSMLSSDFANLLTPKQPAFTEKQFLLNISQLPISSELPPCSPAAVLKLSAHLIAAEFNPHSIAELITEIHIAEIPLCYGLGWTDRQNEPARNGGLCTPVIDRTGFSLLASGRSEVHYPPHRD
ncbi:G-type lectin S-receptor-like serine/threonine-protein kinase At1g11330 [Cornus florida]|uniref:G-type lectin S-receptor-like serine/threonine-protein kinase At1g11330 n=1 Tax=Cornus florida TaxID=4283 RepID=UPI00289B31AB|nr:G-type lectin S-receptor-like serine/threonine-protein kinase At1g11330 [Cornus florida]